jgi:microcystin-dependent protein
MTTPYLSEIKIMAFGFAPKGWAMCNGQLLPINQNQALFALLGTTYGGNGQTTFALPNLQGRVPVHMGDGILLGQLAGEAFHTLNFSEMAQHSHTLSADATTAGANNTNTPGPSAGSKVLGQSAGTTGNPPSAIGVSMYSSKANNGALAPQSLTNNGASQPHENEQPYSVLNFCIALQGIFPSQN